MSSIQKIVERIRKRFALADRSNSPQTDITQYNITKDGAVVQTLVFNFRDLVFAEAPVTDYDVDITISIEDALDLFEGKAILAELNAAVSLSFLCFKKCINLFSFLH